MKYYLSSFRLGNNPKAFASLFGGNRSVAVIANSIDFRNDAERKSSVDREITWLNDLGLNASELDLRQFFESNHLLDAEINKYGGVWARGGNTFILRRAMFQSGFDKLIISKSVSPDFVYGGYSAGVCVLSPDLHGIENVDDPNVVPDTYMKEIVWEGIRLIDYYFAPHYRSVHPESEMVNKKVEEWKKDGRYFRALSDGEVIIN